MSIPTFEEVENGVLLRYWDCPINFIPKNIYEFFMLYDYHKQFTGVKMPAYKNTSKRFLKACQYFEAKFSESLQIKRKMGDK